MDQNLRQITHSKVHRVISNLERNNMKGHFVESIDQLKKLLSELIPSGSSIAVGGSMTLFETGIIDWIRDNDYIFYDRYATGLNSDDLKAIHRKAFSADAYLCSVNAITECGELYNVDGNGNRVAAMIYGPDKVITVVGLNKIVKDLPAAINRNREISAPANNVRLNTGTPCTHTGTCTDCKTPSRICCAYTTIGFQRTPDRIHVVFIDDVYGY